MSSASYQRHLGLRHARISEWRDCLDVDAER